MAEATHIGRDDVEPLGQRLDVQAPLVVEAGPAVDEEERRAAPFAYVVVFEAVDGGVVVIEGFGVAQTGRSYPRACSPAGMVGQLYSLVRPL